MLPCWGTNPGCCTLERRVEGVGRGGDGKEGEGRRGRRRDEIKRNPEHSGTHERTVNHQFPPAPVLMVSETRRDMENKTTIAAEERETVRELSVCAGLLRAIRVVGGDWRVKQATSALAIVREMS